MSTLVTGSTFALRSSDGGRTWTPPQMLNDDDPKLLRAQFMPNMNVAPNGRIAVEMVVDLDLLAARKQVARREGLGVRDHVLVVAARHDPHAAALGIPMSVPV